MKEMQGPEVLQARSGGREHCPKHEIRSALGERVEARSMHETEMEKDSGSTRNAWAFLSNYVLGGEGGCEG